MAARGPSALAYRLLLWLLAPALLLYTLGLALRGGGGRYLRQRLGLGHPHKAVDVWLHAASVGEVNAALPLLRLLRQRRPEAHLLLTTTTPSGAATARRQLPEGIDHAYLPIDWPGAVRRFVARRHPRCALIMETELWPHLYAACARAGVPLVIVNGRLSLRTLRAPLWLRRLYRDCLQQVSAILAISENDRTGFIALGAAAERVEVCGNIKFAAPPGDAPKAIALPRPYVLAASTREHEEKALLEAWRAAQTDGRLLVVVPRHPKRRAQILRDLASFGLEVAVRSRGEEIGEQTAVYLADTFGELGGFMAGAELVFMGGSLVPKGGQNLLEAARLGKAVLFGQHMENFADEARQLLGAEAALQVDSPTALGEQLTRLLAEPARREELGQKATALMAEQSDMAERYLAAIARYCPGG